MQSRTERPDAVIDAPKGNWVDRYAPERWRPWLRRVRAMKPHELSEELETFLAEQMPVSAQWPRLFDETLADLRVKAGDAAGAFGHPALSLGGRHAAAPEPRLGPDRLRAAPIAPLRTEG